MVETIGNSVLGLKKMGKASTVQTVSPSYLNSLDESSFSKTLQQMGKYHKPIAITHRLYSKLKKPFSWKELTEYVKTVSKNKKEQNAILSHVKFYTSEKGGSDKYKQWKYVKLTKDGLIEPVGDWNFKLYQPKEITLSFMGTDKVKSVISVGAKGDVKVIQSGLVSNERALLVHSVAQIIGDIYGKTEYLTPADKAQTFNQLTEITSKPVSENTIEQVFMLQTELVDKVGGKLPKQYFIPKQHIDAVFADLSNMIHSLSSQQSVSDYQYKLQKLQQELGYQPVKNGLYIFTLEQYQKFGEIGGSGGLINQIHQKLETAKKSLLSSSIVKPSKRVGIEGEITDDKRMQKFIEGWKEVKAESIIDQTTGHVKSSTFFSFHDGIIEGQVQVGEVTNHSIIIKDDGKVLQLQYNDKCPWRAQFVRDLFENMGLNAQIIGNTVKANAKSKPSLYTQLAYAIPNIIDLDLGHGYHADNKRETAIKAILSGLAVSGNLRNASQKVPSDKLMSFLKTAHEKLGTPEFQTYLSSMIGKYGTIAEKEALKTKIETDKKIKEMYKPGVVVEILGGSYGHPGEKGIVEKIEAGMVYVKSLETDKVYDKYPQNVKLAVDQTVKKVTPKVGEKVTGLYPGQMVKITGGWYKGHKAIIKTVGKYNAYVQIVKGLTNVPFGEPKLKNWADLQVISTTPVVSEKLGFWAQKAKDKGLSEKAVNVSKSMDEHPASQHIISEILEIKDDDPSQASKMIDGLKELKESKIVDASYVDKILKAVEPTAVSLGKEVPKVKTWYEFAKEAGLSDNALMMAYIIDEDSTPEAVISTIKKESNVSLNQLISGLKEMVGKTPMNKDYVDNILQKVGESKVKASYKGEAIGQGLSSEAIHIAGLIDEGHNIAEDLANWLLKYDVYKGEKGLTKATDAIKSLQGAGIISPQFSQKVIEGLGAKKPLEKPTVKLPDGYYYNKAYNAGVTVEALKVAGLIDKYPYASDLVKHFDTADIPAVKQLVNAEVISHLSGYSIISKLESIPKVKWQFKVGDKVKHKVSGEVGEVVGITLEGGIRTQFGITKALYSGDELEKVSEPTAVEGGFYTKLAKEAGFTGTAVKVAQAMDLSPEMQHYGKLTKKFHDEGDVNTLLSGIAVLAEKGIVPKHYRDAVIKEVEKLAGTPKISETPYTKTFLEGKKIESISEVIPGEKYFITAGKGQGVIAKAIKTWLPKGQSNHVVYLKDDAGKSYTKYWFNLQNV